MFLPKPGGEPPGYIPALLERGIRDELKEYLKLAADLEYKSGQSIYHGQAPKPYALAAIAQAQKAEGRGAALVERIEEGVKAGQDDIEVDIPDPVPPAVLDGLTFPNGAQFPPSLKRWLAFDRS